MARGGKREGAGRKAPNGARVSICARVSRQTAEVLRDLKGEQSLGRLIDKIVEHYTQTL